jgi:2-succinyl-6-hydroxy-2,4-cyclohexadiene-1-carboxylate synthase
MEEVLLQVNGLHLGVRLEMKGERTTNQQTLVFLHGFTGSADSWSDLFPKLAYPGRCLIALDMLGHGRTDAPADPARYAIERVEEDIVAALLLLGIPARSAILLGYSMGGRIALYTAFSGFFRALILESASPGLRTSAEREQRRLSDEALAARIERTGVPAFVEYWEQLPLFASQRTLPEEVRTTLRTQRLRNCASGLANSLRGIGTGSQPSLYERLPTLDLPVLLLAGENDQKFCQIAHEMARQLPRATLHVVPGAGHTVHLEQPEPFISLVHHFCQEVYLQETTTQTSEE